MGWVFCFFFTGWEGVRKIGIAEVRGEGDGRGKEEQVVIGSPEAAPSEVSPAGAATPGLRAPNRQELSRTHTDIHIGECVCQCVTEKNRCLRCMDGGRVT